MAMISELVVQAFLMTLLLLMNLVRLFLLCRFQSNWSAYKVDLALCASSCISFAVLSGLLWSKKFPPWSQVLMWITPIFASLQVVGLATLLGPPLWAYHITVPPRELSTARKPSHAATIAYLLPSFRRAFQSV